MGKSNQMGISSFPFNTFHSLSFCWPHQLLPPRPPQPVPPSPHTPSCPTSRISPGHAICTAKSLTKNLKLKSGGKEHSQEAASQIRTKLSTEEYCVCYSTSCTRMPQWQSLTFTQLISKIPSTNLSQSFGQLLHGNRTRLLLPTQEDAIVHFMLPFSVVIHADLIQLSVCQTQMPA